MLGVTYFLFSYFVVILFGYGISNSLVRGNVRVIFYLISFASLNGLRVIGQQQFKDIENYREIFYLTSPLWDSVFFNNSNLEGIDTDIGYLFINAVFRSLGFSFEAYLFILFAVQTAIFYRFSKAVGVAPVVSFSVYVAIILMTFQIGMLRQALAFCFFLVAIEFLDRKKIFTVLILVAATFHLSALFCLSLIWIDKRININLFYLSFLISLVLYLMEINVLAHFIHWIEYFSQLGRVLFYLDVDRANNFLGIGFWERVLSFFAICAIRIDLIKTHKQTSSLDILFKIAAFSIIFQILLAAEPTIVSRLRLYTQIFPVLYIAHYIFTVLYGRIYWLYRAPYMVYLAWYFTFQINYLIVNSY
jgi:transmembrane protein EpsG